MIFKLSPYSGWILFIFFYLLPILQMKKIINKKIMFISFIFMYIFFTGCSNDITGNAILERDLRENIYNDTIKIGAILPLTGNFAFKGKNSLNGIEMAVDEINLMGGIDGR